jgi:hypothetical protein
MLKTYLLDKEYSPWPSIKFSLQTIHYFQDVRKLCAKSLDPKSKPIDEYITHDGKVKLFDNLTSLNPNMQTFLQRFLRVSLIYFGGFMITLMS